MGQCITDRAMDMVEAGVASYPAGGMSGKTTRIPFMPACEQCERNKNKKRLGRETSESVSAPG